MHQRQRALRNAVKVKQGVLVTWSALVTCNAWVRYKVAQRNFSWLASVWAVWRSAIWCLARCRQHQILRAEQLLRCAFQPWRRQSLAVFDMSLIEEQRAARKLRSLWASWRRHSKVQAWAKLFDLRRLMALVHGSFAMWRRWCRALCGCRQLAARCGGRCLRHVWQDWQCLMRAKAWWLQHERLHAGELLHAGWSGWRQWILARTTLHTRSSEVCMLLSKAQQQAALARWSRATSVQSGHKLRQAESVAQQKSAAILRWRAEAARCHAERMRCEQMCASLAVHWKITALIQWHHEAAERKVRRTIFTGVALALRQRAKAAALRWLCHSAVTDKDHKVACECAYERIAWRRRGAAFALWRQAIPWTVTPVEGTSCHAEMSPASPLILRDLVNLQSSPSRLLIVAAGVEKQEAMAGLNEAENRCYSRPASPRARNALVPQPASPDPKGSLTRRLLGSPLHTQRCSPSSSRKAGGSRRAPKAKQPSEDGEGIREVHRRKQQRLLTSGWDAWCRCCRRTSLAAEVRNRVQDGLLRLVAAKLHQLARALRAGRRCMLNFLFRGWHAVLRASEARYIAVSGLCQPCAVDAGKAWAAWTVIHAAWRLAVDWASSRTAGLCRHMLPAWLHIAAAQAAIVAALRGRSTMRPPFSAWGNRSRERRYAAGSCIKILTAVALDWPWIQLRGHALRCRLFAAKRGPRELAALVWAGWQARCMPARCARSWGRTRMLRCGFGSWLATVQAQEEIVQLLRRRHFRAAAWRSLGQAFRQWDAVRGGGVHAPADPPPVADSLRQCDARDCPVAQVTAPLPALAFPAAALPLPPPLPQLHLSDAQLLEAEAVRSETGPSVQALQGCWKSRFVEQRMYEVKLMAAAAGVAASCTRRLACAAMRRWRLAVQAHKAGERLASQREQRAIQRCAAAWLELCLAAAEAVQLVCRACAMQRAGKRLRSWRRQTWRAATLQGVRAHKAFVQLQRAFAALLRWLGQRLRLRQARVKTQVRRAGTPFALWALAAAVHQRVAASGPKLLNKAKHWVMLWKTGSIMPPLVLMAAWRVAALELQQVRCAELFAAVAGPHRLFAALRAWAHAVALLTLLRERARQVHAAKHRRLFRRWVGQRCQQIAVRGLQERVRSCWLSAVLHSWGRLRARLRASRRMRARIEQEQIQVAALSWLGYCRQQQSARNSVLQLERLELHRALSCWRCTVVVIRRWWKRETQDVNVGAFMCWRIAVSIVTADHETKLTQLRSWRDAVRVGRSGRLRLCRFRWCCEQSSVRLAELMANRAAAVLAEWRHAAMNAVLLRLRCARCVEAARLQPLCAAFRGLQQALRQAQAERQRRRLISALLGSVEGAARRRQATALGHWQGQCAKLNFCRATQHGRARRAWAGWCAILALRRRLDAATRTLAAVMAARAMKALRGASPAAQAASFAAWRSTGRDARAWTLAALLLRWRHVACLSQARHWFAAWRRRVQLGRLRRRLGCRHSLGLWRGAVEEHRTLERRLGLARGYATWRLLRRAVGCWLLAGPGAGLAEGMLRRCGARAWVLPAATLCLTGVLPPNGGRADKLSLWAAAMRVTFMAVHGASWPRGEGEKNKFKKQMTTLLHVQ